MAVVRGRGGRAFRNVALVLATFGGVTAGTAAQAEPVIGIAQAAQRTFDIPPQSLAGALAAFGQQSGMQVSISAGLAQGVSSPGATGALTPSQALDRLLSGTGIIYRITGNTAMLQRLSDTGAGVMQLDPVQVQGVPAVPAQAEIGNLPPPYAGGEVARGGRVGVLGNRDYMDTPFSTTTYTEKYLKENQARTVVDAVANDPTIRPQYGQSQADDRLMIRGFSLMTVDMAFNGMYGVTPHGAMPLFGVERVEVFRGPSALLGGIPPTNAIGGTINFVPKRATDAPITDATAFYASNSQFGGQVDFGRRFGPDNSLGLRLNGYFMSGDTAVNAQTDQLGAFTLGFDFRSERTRFDADFGYFNRLLNAPQGSVGVAAGVPVPAAPNASTNFYQPWEFRTYAAAYGMMRLEHDFTPGITGFVKVGGRWYQNTDLFGFQTIVNSLGNTTSTPRKAVGFFNSNSVEIGGRARFETGPLNHEAVLSGSYLHTASGNQTRNTPAVTSNIYSPIFSAAPNLNNYPTNAPLTNDTMFTSLALLDAISIADDRVQLIAGARLQRIQIANWNVNTGIAQPNSDQSALSPSVSLVVKPLKQLSVYGNYIQALEPGAIAGAGLANTGQVFPPFVSTQFEIGTKLDLGKFGATLSAFQITRPSSFVNVTTNSLVVDGRQTNRGIEFMMFGEPISGLKPLGGFSIIDARLDSTAGGVNNGKFAPGVPAFQANFGLDWDTPFLKGLSLSGRVIYTGLTQFNATNTQQVPAWTRVDLGAGYTFERPGDNKPITLRANVINLGNNNYWMGQPGFMTQGAPRTFLLSLAASF